MAGSIDPDVKVITDAHEARLAALEARTTGDPNQRAAENANADFISDLLIKQQAKTYAQQVTMFTALDTYLATL